MSVCHILIISYSWRNLFITNPYGIVIEVEEDDVEEEVEVVEVEVVEVDVEVVVIEVEVVLDVDVLVDELVEVVEVEVDVVIDWVVLLEVLVVEVDELVEVVEVEVVREVEVVGPASPNATITSAHREAAPRVHEIVTDPGDACVFSAIPPSTIPPPSVILNNSVPESNVNVLAVEPLHPTATTTALEVRVVTLAVSAEDEVLDAEEEACGAVWDTPVYVTAIPIAPATAPVKVITTLLVPVVGAIKYHNSDLSVSVAPTAERPSILVMATPA